MPKQNKNINKGSSVPPNLNEGFLSVSEIAKLSPYSSSYLSLRIRQGKLKGEKIGRNWFTKREWLNHYIIKHGEKEEILTENKKKEDIVIEDKEFNVKVATNKSIVERDIPKPRIPKAINQKTTILRPLRRDFDIFFFLL